MSPPQPPIWGIHAGKMGDADSLFKKGFVAIGWMEVDDLAKLPADREAFKQLYATVYPQTKPAAIPVNAGQLFRFVHEMKAGDLVVNRSRLEQVIRIGKITGPYQYDPEHEPSYPHRHAAQWLRTIQPVQVSQGALYELGAAMSLFQLKNYADEWRALLTGAVPSSTEPAEDDPSTSIVTEDIEQLTQDFILKRLLQELKGHPFAAFVGHLLGTMGYRTRISPEGPDGGVDIIAHRDELGFEPPLVKVQVKSGTGNIGQPDVSALIGTLSPNEFGLVVTLGGFTSQARNFARNKSNIRLIDGAELVELVLAHYDQFDSRYKGLLPLKRVYVPDLESDAS